jgi:hypothetical protein
VNPALQEHAAIAELDSAECEFAGHDKHTDNVFAPTVAEYVPTPQSVHAAPPLFVLYLPATQAVQTPPSGPVLPAAHGTTGFNLVVSSIKEDVNCIAVTPMKSLKSSTHPCVGKFIG